VHEVLEATDKSKFLRLKLIKTCENVRADKNRTNVSKLLYQFLC